MLADLDFRELAQIAVAEGAVTPDPGGAGCIAYSTTLGRMVQWDGASWLSIRTQEPDVQLFTADGTWTKPAGALRVLVMAQGGGGGGGAGPLRVDTDLCWAGGGGAKGQYVAELLDASDVSSTVSVSVGAGGAGGAAQTTSNSDGADGTAGGNSTFGAYVTALGGGGGIGGRTSAQLPTEIPGFDWHHELGRIITSYITISLDRYGGPPGQGERSLGTSTSSNHSTAGCFGSGGGAGGGIAASSSATEGSRAGSPHSSIAESAFGASTGAAGANGAIGSGLYALAGAGGGGGYGGNNITNGGAGGNGADAGCGGGGGGGGRNGMSSGKGGNGGKGWVKVIAFFS